MDENIGKEILEKRKSKGLTQGDIASHCGVSIQAVSKWERGIAKPSENIVSELVDFLGLSVETRKKDVSSAVETFIKTVSSELTRIISSASIIASTFCFSTGLIGVESCAIISGCGIGVFCFATMIKSK